MIKKLLLATAFILSGISLVNAQCTPNVSCSALICPDTTTNLPHGMAGAYYSTTITVKVPTDTTLSGLGTVTIDTIKCLSVTGLPTGFTATPNVVAGWAGGTMGCLEIAGTTTNAGAGRRDLVINISIKTSILTIPSYSLTGYRIIVDSSNGISTMNQTKFSLSQNSPNPFASKTNIEFTSSVPDVFNFTVYDVIGNVVYSRSINANTGLNNFDFFSGNLTSGMYFYKLSNNVDSYTRRMIVANK